MDSAAPPPCSPKNRASEAGTRPVDLLVEAFREGKPGAFDAIVRAHQDRVYAFCTRMLSDREDAQDVAQEVFLSGDGHVDAHDSSLFGKRPRPR